MSDQPKRHIPFRQPQVNYMWCASAQHAWTVIGFWNIERRVCVCVQVCGFLWWHLLLHHHNHLYGFIWTANFVHFKVVIIVIVSLARTTTTMKFSSWYYLHGYFTEIYRNLCLASLLCVTYNHHICIRCGFSDRHWHDQHHLAIFIDDYTVCFILLSMSAHWPTKENIFPLTSCGVLFGMYCGIIYVILQRTFVKLFIYVWVLCEFCDRIYHVIDADFDI